MATVYRENRATPARQYISTAAFDQYLWTYTLTTDPNTFVQTGTFANLSAANSTNCPRGRILRENGERLYPGQSGVNTLMVKVFDSNSGLSGYIDPNAEVFALYNADRPVSAVDGFENNATSGVHKGPSLYTAGDIIADGGSLRVTGTADISGALTVASGQIRAATVTSSTTTTGTLTINPSLGQVFTFTNTLTGAVSLACAAAPPAGSVVYVMFTDGGNRALSAGSNVALSPVTMTNAKRYSLTLVSNGTTLVAVSQLQYA